MYIFMAIFKMRANILKTPVRLWVPLFRYFERKPQVCAQLCLILIPNVLKVLNLNLNLMRCHRENISTWEVGDFPEPSLRVQMHVWAR